MSIFPPKEPYYTVGCVIMRKAWPAAILVVWYDTESHAFPVSIAQVCISLN